MPKIGKKPVFAYLDSALFELRRDGKTQLTAYGITMPTAIKLSAMLKKMGYPRKSMDVIENTLPVKIKSEDGKSWVNGPNTHEIPGVIIVHEALTHV